MATRTLNVAITSDTRQFKRALGDLEQSTKKTESRLKGFANVAKGSIATFAGAEVVRQVVGLGAAMVNTASDINESLSKNERLFGRHAAGIDKWSKSTAASLGISRKEALAATGSFGALFETIGLADRPAAQMSRRLTTLAGDLASFYNANTTDSLEALRSGLAGEAEPMRKFGALLSENRVKQEAWRLGIAKHGQELTEQQKIQARYRLILKDTAIAHGDARKTGDQLAGSTRRLNAQIQDIGGKIGAKLLPVVRDAANWLNRFLRQMQTGKGAGGDFRRAMEALGRGIEVTAREVGKAFRDIREAIRLTKGAVSGLVSFTAKALQGDWKGAWEEARLTVRDKLRGDGNSVLRTIAGLSDPIGLIIRRLGHGMAGDFERSLNGLGAAIKRKVVAEAKKGLTGAGRDIAKIIPGLQLVEPIAKVFGKDAGDAAANIVGSIPGGAMLGAGGGGDTGGLQIEARSGLAFLRSQFGGLTLSSGRRSPAENARVGGAPNSDHLTGLGTDLVPAEGWTFAGINRLDRIAAWARKSPLIRWIGWRGVKGHGPYNHLHLSWVDRMKGDVRAAAGMFGRHPKERVVGLGGGTAGDTVPQIRNLWTRAGGSAAAANMAAAIAMAESSGDPGAKNVNSDGSIDRGLWQINSVHGALSTFSRLGNAKAAVRISGNGRNWNPWVTFKTGAYRAFLSAAGGKGGGGGPHARRMSPAERFAQSQQNTADAADAAIRNAAHGAGGPLSFADLVAARNRRRSGAVGTGGGGDGDLGGGSGDTSDPALEENNRLIEEQNRLIQQRIDVERELASNQALLLKLAGQGDQIVGAVIAAVNGGIGGRVGLGFQSPGYAGGVARY